jgi:hypothetical protein
MQLHQCSSSTDTLKSIYFVYVHSIMKYGIIFWGNFPNSKMIFTLQKRTVRTIAGLKSRNSYRNLLMRLEILPLPCKYTFTVMNSVVNNQDKFSSTVSTLRIGNIFIDQLPNFHVFKKVHSMLALKSSTVYHQISEVLRIKRHNLK